MRTYLRFKSPQQAPSMLAPMTLKEFAMRAQQDSPDSPLFYPHGEFYYMQSPVTQDMRRSGDLDFEQPPFSAVLAPGMGVAAVHCHALCLLGQLILHHKYVQVACLDHHTRICINCRPHDCIKKASTLLVKGLNLMISMCTTPCSMLQMRMVRGKLFQLQQQGFGSAPEGQSLLCTLTVTTLSSYKCEEPSGCCFGAQINYTEHTPTEIGIF